MEEKLVFYAEPATMAQPTALGNGKLRFKKGGGEEENVGWGTGQVQQKMVNNKQSTDN